jgi:uncharacterized RDD family membrane protein YckC
MAAPPDPPPARRSRTRPAVQPRAARIPAAGAGPDAVVNPFPGLRPFREDEEHLFFGRESQIDRMADKLAHRRFLAVVGTSGSGKSSLVNCGLRPALHRGLVTRAGTAWRIVQFRPGATPVANLASALASDRRLFADVTDAGMPLDQIVSATLAMSNLGLADIYEQAHVAADTNLLVVVDQFEELFRYRQLAPGRRDPHSVSEEATQFVNLLLAAHAQDQCPIYVVLTMRSDFLGDCAQFYGLPEAINEGQYLVPRMTRQERRAAIEGPIAVAGAEISPVLLTRLVNDTGDNPDQLSILQHALNRTWAHWEHQAGGRGPLLLESYETIGTMAHALDRHAEKAFAELRTDRKQRICAKIFKALTDKGTDARGIRRPTTLERLCAIAGAPESEVIEVIDVFRKPSRSFLMPPVPDVLAPDTVIDISHESLMRVWKRLDAWTAEEAESARMFRRLQDSAARRVVGRAGLWRDPDLQFALDWREREQPNEAWADFYGAGLDGAIALIDDSKLAQDRHAAEIDFERRWLQRFLVPGGLVLLVLILVTARVVQDRDLVAALIPAVLGGALRTVLRFVIELAMAATPFVLAGLGLAHWGRQWYRRWAFPDLLRRQAAASGVRSPARVSESATATEEEAIVPAPMALHTGYAPFGRRVVGRLVDAGVSLLVLMGVAVPWGVAHTLMYGAEAPVGDAASLAMIGTWVVVDWLYQAMTTSSKRSATLGMMAVGIIVTDTQGKRLSFLRATARSWARLLSYYSGMIGFLMQPFTARKQTLHDLITRSVVLVDPARVAVTAPQVAPVA